MDIEKFNQWSRQLEVMLGKLTDHERAMQLARQRQLSSDNTISGCQTQVALEKHLSRMANDIRALGFCYNNLRSSIYMQQEQFDALERQCG